MNRVSARVVGVVVAVVVLCGCSSSAGGTASSSRPSASTSSARSPASSPSPTVTSPTSPAPTSPTASISAASNTTPQPTGPPRIAFSSVPSIGSTDVLTGRVRNADPELYRVVVFIEVDGIWWVKPYWAQPLTDIAADGTWTCDIVTGGHDQDATAIEAFVVRSTIQLPSQPWWPDVEPHALAHVYTSRS